MWTYCHKALNNSKITRSNFYFDPRGQTLIFIKWYLQKSQEMKIKTFGIFKNSRSQTINKLILKEKIFVGIGT